MESKGAQQSWLASILARLKDVSKSKKAPWVLALVASTEAVFFPIPPDALLLPLCVGAPKKSLWFASICTIASIFGAIVGYFIGFFLWDTIDDYFFFLVPGFDHDAFEQLQSGFQAHGVWFVFAAAFSPIPFKLFTLSSGALGLDLGAFILASTIGRSCRFFLIGGAVRALGPSIQHWIERYLGPLTLVLVAVGGLAYLLGRFLF